MQDNIKIISIVVAEGMKVKDRGYRLYKLVHDILLR